MEEGLKKLHKWKKKTLTHKYFEVRANNKNSVFLGYRSKELITRIN